MIGVYANFLEYFKTIGALAGFLSVAFQFYDRIIRNRPVAFFSLADNQQLVMIIRNVANYPVFIQSVTSNEPNIYFPKSEEIIELIHSQIRKDLFLQIDPNSESKFLINSRYKDGNHTWSNIHKFDIKITWRRSDRLTIWQYPITVKMDKKFMPKQSQE